MVDQCGLWWFGVILEGYPMGMEHNNGVQFKLGCGWDEGGDVKKGGSKRNRDAAWSWLFPHD